MELAPATNGQGGGLQAGLPGTAGLLFRQQNQVTVKYSIKPSAAAGPGTSGFQSAAGGRGGPGGTALRPGDAVNSLLHRLQGMPSTGVQLETIRHQQQAALEERQAAADTLEHAQQQLRELEEEAAGLVSDVAARTQELQAAQEVTAALRHRVDETRAAKTKLKEEWAADVVQFLQYSTASCDAIRQLRQSYQA